ncbi:hypothetical protein SAMN05518669_12756 [Variovorax sp. YR634]|uniref:hypothetical protein n=1 Tax=Variovorax sp. YR634 TaxID=1884385 RepID=UPI00089C9A7A|nr:hypothetical protein [Variovorax sp. YR634]SDZ30800.1 hypothetical protein SAMN05518669_12756 [Variovorax sp. YR634]
MQHATCLMNNGRKTLRRVSPRWKFGSIERGNSQWFASRSFQVNPYSEQILATLRAGTGAAWQKLSWLQYLRWVANSDSRYADPGLVERDLREMDERWGEVNDELRILLTDRFNNGSHVRWWINALSEGLGRR